MWMKRATYIFGISLLGFSLWVEIVGIDSVEKPQSFAIDFPKYVGWTVDSMLADIGYTPEYSHVYYLVEFAKQPVSYSGCYFIYRQNVSVSVHFDSLVYNPPGRDDIIRDVNHFKNERIWEIEVRIDCPSNDENIDQ